LMIGLEGVIPNVDDRERHILDNMIYVVDIQPEMVEVCIARLQCEVTE